MKKVIFAILLIALGILFRTVWHVGPNVEFVTAATLLAVTYLGRKAGFLVPLVIMTVSDLIIGNTNIFIFTWSAYLMIGILNGALVKKKNVVIRQTLFGVVASLFFFLWTNFGVWALDSFGMYSKDLSGLVRAYFMGLPFLRFNLIGNLVFISTSFWIVEKVKSINFAGKPFSALGGREG